MLDTVSIQHKETNTFHQTIVFFDGVCNLCHGAVNWLLERDRHKTLRFAPLQGTTFRVFSEQYPDLIPNDLSTIVFYSKGHVYTYSSAILAIGTVLGGIWRLVSLAGRIIPRFLRDIAYKILSRNRYRWFGKRDTCLIPTPELSARFLP